MSLVQVQVYLDEGLAARLVEAAREADRSVSREAARRLEASFGGRGSSVSPRSVSAPVELLQPQPEGWGEPRVPPEPPPAAMSAHPDPHPYTTPLPATAEQLMAETVAPSEATFDEPWQPTPLAETLKAVKERTGKCLAYTPRGTRCKVCGKTH